MRNTFLLSFTGRDNSTVDLGRVLWAVLTLTLAVLEAHAALWRLQPFDPVAFGGGAAAILAAGGAALGFKAATEPRV